MLVRVATMSDSALRPKCRRLVHAIIAVLGAPAWAQFVLAQETANYISFNAPGDFAITSPASINEFGAVAGNYACAAPNCPTHGFVRSAQGQITSFDPPGSVFTLPLSINLAGAITGVYATEMPGVNHGFVRDPQGEITAFNPAGSHACNVISQCGTFTVSINTWGTVAGVYGDWENQAFRTHGFLRAPNGAIVSFDPPSGSISPGPIAINDLVLVTGSYEDADRVNHGFVRNSEGGFTSFAVPGATVTSPVGINIFGAIAGTWNAGGSIIHGFVRGPGGAITTFDPRGSQDTFVSSINAIGEITGTYLDANFASHGFLRNPNGTIITFDPPGSSYTATAASVNDLGAITGQFSDSTGQHGYIRQP